MDNRAAEQYLASVFGTRRGYVAVAYKDPNVPSHKSWQDAQFAWPADKRKLIAWAATHEQDANIFICPALRRDAHTRKKGDGVNLQWLWADVDWQAVPKEKLQDVKDRIADLSTLTVKSGSGDNLHVYVKLTKPVSSEEFIKLNTGLRNYLYADNKQADNSLLRLPGTTNWKTKAGSPVILESIRGNQQSSAVLMRRRAFRDARVLQDVDATEWTFVNVEGLPARIQRKVRMDVATARGIYNKRHAAVWAITKDLIRFNLDPDEIHSLMDKFPPAIDKMAEENGYDVHRDVDKCLAAHRVVEEIAPDLSHDEVDEVLQELTNDEEKVLDRSELEDRAKKIAFENRARKRAREIESEQSWIAPPPDISWSLTDALRNPPQPVPHLIQGLAGRKHNVVITAQYKTGKTSFVMGSLVSSLVDGKPFLNHFEVMTGDEGVVVGHWNCEMDPQEMLDDYIRPVNIENTDNVQVANLRGYPVNVLSPVGRRWAVDWLTTHRVKVWTIDSFARLCRMAGVSEKDNDEVMSLLMALDEIKMEAGIDVLFLITHTGRAEMEEGKERARGATAIDDWCDARWIMTRVDKARFLRVEGRGVVLPDTALVYDEDTKRSVLGFGGKTEVQNDTAKDAVVKVVHEAPGITQRELLIALKGVGISSRAAREPIEEAVEGGFIEIRKENRGRGKNASCHYPAGSLQGTSRVTRGTPATVDLRGVAVRTGRRRS